jgi:hypothetical protein
MAFYYSLNKQDQYDRRIAERLLLLKKGIKTSIPERTVDSTLLIATWNIREFDSPKFGPRSKECLFYIAEIISSFDLVAVQEVNENLEALKTVMKILGNWWKFMTTDVTQGSRGNKERITFLYDSRVVQFAGLAGEVVIPPIEEKGKTISSAEQFYRTPFAVGLMSAWFNFVICSVHIVYGKGVANDPVRLAEIKKISEFLVERSKEKYTWSKNWILLGDFNIFKPSDETFSAITDAGFKIPPESKLPTNILGEKHFDQIAFILEDKAAKKLQNIKAGVFNYYEFVYKLDTEDEQYYAVEMGKKYSDESTVKKKTNYYKMWRTYQMSDHLPKWVEIKIDFGEEYLIEKSKT